MTPMTMNTASTTSSAASITLLTLAVISMPRKFTTVFSTTNAISHSQIGTAEMSEFIATAAIR